MAIASPSGRGRQLLFALGAVRRAVARRFHASILYRWRYAGRVPDRLLIAPIDLRTADPTVALDIYAGRWVFNCDGLDIDGFSIFDAEPPSKEWSRSLHSFGWLRHLRASDTTLSRSNARSLIDEWIRYARHDAIAWEPEVVARRVMAWLSQTPLVLEGCDYAFYRSFMRSITRQVRYLRRVAYDGPPGIARLRTMTALAAAALSMSDQGRFLKQATRRLDLELANQIMPDGGHVSRNPAVVLEALTALLPLRQAYAARGGQPSRILVSAIDRMMPMLRFLRQGDGTLAHFNGIGDTATDQLATVLAYDDVRGVVPVSAPHSGYQRLQAGSIVLLVDTGRPPPIDFSFVAHAGCLSFEMSVGHHRMIVNCGVPSPNNTSLRRLARTTAAHSTVTLNDSSSCRFMPRSRIAEWLGEPIVAGPTEIDVERRTATGSTVLIMRHNGYVNRSHIVHERLLSLSDAGDRLEGIDTFLSPSGRPVSRSGRDAYAIRFHLHPSVHADLIEGGRAVHLELPDGECWTFETDAIELALEESIMMSDTRTNRRTDQVVVYGRVQQNPSVAWYLHRTALGPRRQRAAAPADEATVGR